MYIKVCVATLTSRVQDFMLTKNKLSWNKTTLRAWTGKFSQQKAVIVKTKGNTVGHVPDLLAHALAPEISGGNIVPIEAVVTGKPRSAPEGTWVIGGGIETSCKYLSYTDKKLKIKIRTMLRKASM